jgi:hypothetical protein
MEPHMTQVREGRLNGTEIRFAIDLGAGPRIFRGRVEGDAIHGIMPQGWSATRTKQ